MKLPIIKLDDRTHEDIVRDAKALIREHLPEWTDANPSDPGITLVELFAWMTDMLIYRINRIPDRMVLTLLNLMGIERAGPKPARALLTFKFDDDPKASDDRDSVAVPQATFVDASKASASGDPIRFATATGFNISRTQLRHAVTMGTEFAVQVDRRTDEKRDYTYFEAETSFDAFQGVHAIERAIYIGCAEALSDYWAGGELTFDIRVGEPGPESPPWRIGLDFWDGRLWQPIAAADERPSPQPRFVDETGDLTNDGRLTIQAMPASIERSVHSTTSRWLRLGLRPTDGHESEFLALAGRLPALTSIRHRVKLEIEKGSRGGPPLMLLDALAIAGSAEPPDAPPKSFHPFGVWPAPGQSFCFCFQEAFARGGAKIGLLVSADKPLEGDCSVRWEFFTAGRWRLLGYTGKQPPEASDETTSGRITDDETNGFKNSEGGRIELELPRAGIQPTTVAGLERRWLRVTIDYTDVKKLPPHLGGKEKTPWGPRFTSFLVTDYSYEGSAPQSADFSLPDHVIASRALTFESCTHLNKAGIRYQPFVAKAGPALYLGFDQRFPPKRTFGIHFTLAASEPERSNAPLATSDAKVQFEYWNGSAWQPFESLEDGTRSLTRSGFVRFVAPSDHANGKRVVATEDKLTDLTRQRELLEARAEQALTNKDKMAANRALQKVFEEIERYAPLGDTAERYWIRAVLIDGSLARPPRIELIRLNTVDAKNEYPVDEEVLGSSDGTPGQKFSISHTPVHEPPMIVVEEPPPDDGAEPRRVTWRRVEDHYESKPSDEHFVFDEENGEVTFGDGRRGKIPAEGRNNVLARYRWHCGEEGNLPRDTISVLVGGLRGCSAVSNIEPSGGGSHAEPVEATRVRGRDALRHRGRAVSLQDFELLAIEATGAVARACATAPHGRPGEILVRIVPNPTPGDDGEIDHRTPLVTTPALLDTVRDFLDHCRLVTTRLCVAEPRFKAIRIIVTPRLRSYPREALIIENIQAELFRLLHPTIGGPGGDGWPFGRALPQSEIYAAVEGVDGIDLVENVEFEDEHGKPMSLNHNTISLERDELPQLLSVRVNVRRETRV